MLNIKIGWSIFAPKNTTTLNIDYLKDFSNFLNTNIKSKYIIHHWTWNVWHWFIKKYWLSKESYDIWKQILNQYFDTIDNIFKLNRISAYDIINNNSDLNQNQSYITWWDISPKLVIISSDETFSYCFEKKYIKKWYIFTDVDWVFDENGKIIEFIDIYNFSKIHFWEKENDVTWSMKSKVSSILFNQNLKEKKVWITNWTNFENMYNILINDKGIWTQILI